MIEPNILYYLLIFVYIIVYHHQNHTYIYMQDHWEKNYIFCLLLYFDKKRTLFFYLLDFILLNMVKMGINIVNNASAYFVHYIHALI